MGSCPQSCANKSNMIPRRHRARIRQTKGFAFNSPESRETAAMTAAAWGDMRRRRARMRERVGGGRAD
eukprot:1270320-Rhodomonas_salina.4